MHDLEFSPVFSISGEITMDTYDDFVGWIESRPRNAPKELKLYINSVGGDLSAGIGIVNIMKLSKLHFTAIILGDAYSCASFIAIAADKRVMYDNALMMTHQYSYGYAGKEHDLSSFNDARALVSKIYLQHYVKYSKLNKQKAEKLLLPPSDVWLSANTALEYGLIDEII